MFILRFYDSDEYPDKHKTREMHLYAYEMRKGQAVLFACYIVPDPVDIIFIDAAFIAWPAAWNVRGRQKD